MLPNESIHLNDADTILFPVVEISGGVFHRCSSMERLALCNLKAFRKDCFRGMIVIDSQGCKFVVRGVKSKRWVIKISLLFLNPFIICELDMEKSPDSVSAEDLIVLILNCRDGVEFRHEHDGGEWDEVLEKIRGATSVREIIELLC